GIRIESSALCQKWREPIARRPHGRAAGSGPSQRRARNAAAVEKNLDPRTALRLGLAQRLAVAPAERCEHAFDVLAGAEPIDRMVDAAAGIDETFEAANLHLVETAASRMHPERAVERLLGLQRLDRNDLGAPAPAAEVHLVLVAGAPALQRGRSIEDGAGFAAGASRPGRFASAARTCVSTPGAT